MVHGPPQASFLGVGWAAVLLVCTTLMCLGSAATAFLMVLRPSLRNMDRATLATERAAIEMEAASKEIERAAIKFQGDCDRTMPELVAASREFQELGRNFNNLGSGITDSVGRPVRVVERAVQGATTGSLRKVVQDLGFITSALTPAMDQWRQRISGLTARFDAVMGQPTPGALEAARQEMEVAATQLRSASQAEQQSMIESWSGQNIEEGEANAAWLEAAQTRAATLVAGVSGGGGGAGSEGVAADPQPRLSSASFEASAALEQVSADGVGLLQRLSGETGDNDAAATAAAKQGARIINDAAAAAERMAQEARSMAMVIESDRESASPASLPDGAEGAASAAAEPVEADSAAPVIVDGVPLGRTRRGLPGSFAAVPQQLPSGAVDVAASQKRPQRPPVAPGLSEEERSLLEQLKDRKDAAQAVFMALSRAEHAATAAAEASSALEGALQRAEERGGWHRRHSFDEEDGGRGSGSDDPGATELPRDGMAGAVPDVAQVLKELTEGD